MNNYVLMNDYQSKSTPAFLRGIIDTHKRMNPEGELQGSPYSFPYYLKDPQCPDQLLLICEDTDEKLDFDYYKFGMGHIVSDELIAAIKGLNCSKYICKKLIAVSAKSDTVIRSDLNLLYFLNDVSFINENGSKLEEDKFGNQIPHLLTLSNNASTYDIFTINKTLLAGYLFLSEPASRLISQRAFAAIKIVSLEDAFKHHCRDHHYDVDLSKKPTRKKLP